MVGLVARTSFAETQKKVSNLCFSAINQMCCSIEAI